MTSIAAHRLSLVGPARHLPQAEGAEADAAFDAWRQIEAALVPVIGTLGFGALYQRCIALRCKQDPWLQAVHDGTLHGDDFNALHQALCTRSEAQAAAAQGELLRVFHEVLTSLLGAPLVDRLLPPIERGPP